MKKLIKKCMKNRYFAWLIRLILCFKLIFDNKKNVAIAVYDLEANPTTFDFVWFLYEANIHFKAKGIIFPTVKSLLSCFKVNSFLIFITFEKTSLLL